MTPGTRLGPYEIVDAIGAGGMGTVYRARDTRLGRDVAIKISAEHFSDRFEREARTIAALNHSHICTLHDVGPNYLVMELVPGQTLADRIREGPIPLDESLRIAKQIGDALQAAHDRGIVHRDLKPANVKITTDGQVKVLDFGLAKLGDSEAVEIDPDHSPTQHPATRTGMILGTAAYMAPEQARGHAVDRRADIWAFGVVLYEMLTGRRPFQGETSSDTIAALLTAEPAWDDVPAGVRPLLRRCLAKDPRKRLRDIGDLDLLLDAPPPVSPRRSWLPWAVAALLLATLGPVTYLHFRERPQTGELIRFQIPQSVNLPASGNIGLSPDGRYLAFLAVGDDGRVRLYVRTMDSLEVRALEGSEVGVHGPPFFWSPDSRFIAFDAGGALKKLNIAGGPAQTLCELTAPAIGGSWNREGDIILGNVGGGILRVSAAGGTPTAITAIDQSRKEDAHLLPSFLPDGRHFVYLRTSRASEDGGGTYVGTIDAKPAEQSTVRLMPYVHGLSYTPSPHGTTGRLLFVREGNLLAQPFDEQRRVLVGDALPIADRVGTFLDTAFFSASSNNLLVYRTTNPESPINWFDRQGKPTGQMFEAAQYAGVGLSPDGNRAVAVKVDPRNMGQADLWLLDATRGGGPRRFTFLAGGFVNSPVWASDGQRVAFSAWGAGGMHVYQKAVDSTNGEELLFSLTYGLAVPRSWSPDGRFMLYGQTAGLQGWDLLVAKLTGAPSSAKAEPIPFARTRFNEEDGRFSPDGRWVAYVSNESGTNEVYVRRFTDDFRGGSAGAGASELVSSRGGTSPRWRRDGKELFYLAPTGTMMAAAVTSDALFRAEPPVALFQTPPNTTFGDVAPDGKRFLLMPGEPAPFTVVLNWMRN